MSCFYLLVPFAVYVKLINCPLPEYPTLTTYFKKKKHFFTLHVK